MADTARSIITTALQWNRAYSPAETVIDADAELALDQLNAMLDSWSNNSITCYAIVEQSVTLTINKASYTIGTSGSPDVNATRPIRVIEGPGAAYIQDSNSVNYPVDVVTRDKWNLIGIRTTTSNIPNTLFYENTFPNGTLRLFPVPNVANTLYFDAFQQLGNLANLNTSFSFPPGYKAAITSNLAIWLKPFFKSAIVDSDLKNTARETKMAVKRANRRTPIAIMDAALVTRAQPTYNVYTDRASR